MVFDVLTNDVPQIADTMGSALPTRCGPGHRSALSRHREKTCTRPLETVRCVRIVGNIFHHTKHRESKWLDAGLAGGVCKRCPELWVACLEGAAPDSTWWLWRLDEACGARPEAEGLWGVHMDHYAVAGEVLCKALCMDGARLGRGL